MQLVSKELHSWVKVNNEEQKPLDVILIRIGGCLCHVGLALSSNEMLHVAKGATGVKASVSCDALLLDDTSKTDTYPYMEINQEDATVTHEATVGKIGDDQIFYLMTRGFSEEEALTLIVNGFMEPFTKELPMEYAVELNRLIKLEMDGSVG